MSSLHRPKAIVSVTNDLVADQRVHKVCTTLVTKGYDVLLVGRLLTDSQPCHRDNYRTHRMRLLFRKKAWFYAEYNLRLLLFLLFRRFDLLVANDLDTLAANAIAGRMKGKTVVYDSHEYFTEVPELLDRPRVRKFWLSIERKFFPGLKKAMTVSQPIADAYQDEYGVEVKVVRNFPHLIESLPERRSSTEVFGTEENTKVILYQGAVNVGRGLEEIIDAMPLVQNACLVIIGDGDVLENLKHKVEETNLGDRVKFLGKMPYADLQPYTLNADLGLSVEKQMGLSYTYALPNKFFDYVQYGTPVLASQLPELVRLNTIHEVAEFIENHNPEHLAEKINALLGAPERLKALSTNCLEARNVWNWENEIEVLDQLL